MMNKENLSAPRQIQPTILPSYTDSNYRMIYQNSATNQISRIDSEHTPTKKDGFNRTVFKSDAITVITKATKMGMQEAQMLDYISVKFAELPDHDHESTFEITLSEYKADFGKSDSKSARNALKRTLDRIANTTYSYNGGDPNNPYNQSFGTQPLLGYSYKNGKAVVTIMPFFKYLLLQQSMPMPYSPLAFKLNPRTETIPFRVLRELLVNKRINAGNKARENRIKVKTLLSKIRAIPSYESVMNSNDRHPTRRIIDPIFKAMERISNPKDGAISDYSFIDKNGKLLDYDNLDYEAFIDSSIVINQWRNYPEDMVSKWAEAKTKKRKTKKASGQRKKKPSKK